MDAPGAPIEEEEREQEDPAPDAVDDGHLRPVANIFGGWGLLLI